MLAGRFVSDGIKAEQGCVLAPTGFNTSFPLLSAPETWGKEPTCLLGSTANCTTLRKYRQLAVLRTEELVWELRFAGDHILFAHRVISKRAQAIHQGARELAEVPLSCTRSIFAAGAAHTSALGPRTRSQAGGCPVVVWVSGTAWRRGLVLLSAWCEHKYQVLQLR